MVQVRVTLSIGYPKAKHEDIIEVDDDEYAACKTEDERQDLLDGYWQEWASNYIDGHCEVIS